MSERKLASIQRISEIKEIEGADSIEAARVNGWWVVAKKNEYKVGDLTIYFEIDSWIPTMLAPFLSKGKEPREFNGVEGERLRTMKLRGQISQGLLLSPKDCLDTETLLTIKEGDDLTEVLGIQKWEAPIPVQLAGIARGNFPSFIPKTDQERIQNLPDVFNDTESKYEVTIKLDGSSMTCYWHEGVFGVCSRNIDLKLDQKGNIFVNTAKRIFEKRDFPGLAIQGELMGPGIQGNHENLKTHEFFVFDIWSIGEQRYFSTSERIKFCEAMGLSHVPIYQNEITLLARNLDDILNLADGPSLNNPVREGLVFKRHDGKFGFKVISNKFLLGEK